LRNRFDQNDRFMMATTIPDEELVADADLVTVWVATPDAPTEFWSLAEAVAWVNRQPGKEKITLFRPPDRQLRAAWVGPAQISRLAFILGGEAAPSAA
jgi:hypothetical protein